MKNTLLFCTLATPLGAMRAMASVQGLCLLEFSDSPAPGLRRAQQQVEALRGGPAQPGKNAVLEQTEQELAQYFARQRQQFSVPLDLLGTPFQCAAWQALLAIPTAKRAATQRRPRPLGGPRPSVPWPEPMAATKSASSCPAIGSLAAMAA